MTLVSSTPLAALPSPSTAVWNLGPVPLRAYALCIIAGIIIACVITERRLRSRGVAPGAVLDIAIYAVPAGIIGARIYHVITSPQAYFGPGGEPVRAFWIWQGGLGIWGAVAGGALGAWFAARQLGIPLSVVADALAPGLPLAQAVGRLGNWFNNELYGGPTTLPWGLEVHKMDPEQPGHAFRGPDGEPLLEPGLYHPTFLYELLWNVGVAVMVYLVDRRWKLGRGRAFALYVMGYTAGRFWIEMMRTDPANTILGLRLNVWTAVLVFVGALVYFLRVRGPRGYLVPLDAEPSPERAATGDVSQLDLSDRGATEAAVPRGYRIVSEEEFRAYRETGALPEADESTGSTVSSEPASTSEADGTAGDGDDTSYDDGPTAHGAGDGHPDAVETVAGDEAGADRGDAARRGAHHDG